MPDLPQEALGAEFDCLMARAGIVIPADRREAILASFADLKGQLALVRQSARTGAAEPSNVFRLPPHGAAR